MGCEVADRRVRHSGPCALGRVTFSARLTNPGLGDLLRDITIREIGEAFLNKSLIRTSIASGTLALLIGAVGVASPAQAWNDDCRYDRWGSSSWNGQKYRCNDGSSLYIKPQYGYMDDWNSTPKNSWETWRGRDSYGNSYRCKWNEWKREWKCR